MRILTLFLLTYAISFSSDVALYKKGQKIVEALCVTKESKISCPKLSSSRQKAVDFYLNSSKDDSNLSTALYISVAKDVKCPVCGMFVYKYPKWSTKMVIDGKSLYFDGVKDMMKYYIFDGDFIYDRKKIDKILVSDYYTLQPILAEDAFFVYDSNLYGPMGREFISFQSKESAKRFMIDHGGKKILRFNEITDKLVMALDG